MGVVVRWLLRRRPPSGAFRALSTAATPATDTDVLVIGAGVVGLAIARRLAAAGREVLLVDRAPSFGTETSSRNSEVIHAGLYYPPGSLKARLCVRGRQLLYDFCREREVAHARLGKFIVASSEVQIPQLATLKATAEANGVNDLKWRSAAEAKAAEPALACAAALESPSTGIVDSYGLMAALLEDFEDHGGTVAFHSAVQGGNVGGAVKTLRVADVGGGGTIDITARAIINAAGLHAQIIAQSLSCLPPASIPPLYLAKGSYYLLCGGTKAPFSRLIYPLPEPGGLGVHLTLDLGGGARFGPNVQWLPPGTAPEALDYSVDPSQGPDFQNAARKFYPDLPEGALDPGYAGVRPKTTGPGEPPGDFVVAGRGAHGVPGVVCMYGIESPGLTASLALAEEVERRLAE